MSTEPRTVSVRLLVSKVLRVDEPDWCTGAHGDRAQFKADVTHYGPEQIIGAHGFDLFRAMLAQSPFTEHDSRSVQLYVEQEDVTGSYTPDEVEQLADALVEAAAQLRALGRDLAEGLAGGEPS
ncbi:DUF6907 domain-containing protein [Streptomyces sp. 1222.5]|uniref:DUF6907 domain-containing protein n=1 Tax=Streptomyces sp. 1222.5 TaxID=1881026 RepID=UPI003D742112